MIHITIFFLISYSLVPNSEICLKYFLEKNIQKRPKCAGICGVSKWKLLSAFVRRKAVRLPNHVLLSFFFPVSVSTSRSHWISKASCLLVLKYTLYSSLPKRSVCSTLILYYRKFFPHFFYLINKKIPLTFPFLHLKFFQKVANSFLKQCFLSLWKQGPSADASWS